MIREPRMDLPSLAMPWGRWFKETTEETQRKIANAQVELGVDSFSAQADNIAAQIRGIQVASIRQISSPGFSDSASGAVGSPRKMMVSANQSFAPPTVANLRCQVIVNFHAVSTAGSVPAGPRLMVNGQQFTEWQADPRRPNGTSVISNEAYYSVNGAVDLYPGQTVNVQYGLALTAFPTTTVTIDQVQLWLAFYGSV